jgi:hypothetical protein
MFFQLYVVDSPDHLDMREVKMVYSGKFTAKIFRFFHNFFFFTSNTKHIGIQYTFVYRIFFWNAKHWPTTDGGLAAAMFMQKRIAGALVWYIAASIYWTVGK